MTSTNRPLSAAVGPPALDEAPQDGHSNVCHECTKAGELWKCDMCHLAWHDDCLTLEMRATLEDDPWACPVCAQAARPGGYVGNPQRAPPGRGGGQHRKRLRSASEGTASQRAAAKAAGRSREVRFRG